LPAPAALFYDATRILRRSDFGAVRSVFIRASIMKIQTLVKVSVAALLVTSLAACSSMTRSQKHAAIGATAGGAIGYVLTGGPIGTIAGAAVGGVIGAGH
jgi:osmotically inducible lipoprotein OsmB